MRAIAPGGMTPIQGGAASSGACSFISGLILAHYGEQMLDAVDEATPVVSQAVVTFITELPAPIPPKPRYHIAGASAW